MPEKPTEESADSMRLHRYLALCGVASRRKAESLITEGRVKVNGQTVTELGVKITPDTDQIDVDGRRISRPQTVSYLFNKPKGVVTTLSDPQGRKTVADFLPPDSLGLKPVGRLDQDTEGLLILTNDGDLAFRLAHPSFSVDKEYRAVVLGRIEEKALNRLRNGIHLEGKRTAPAEVEVLRRFGKSNETLLKIVIHEGRKHQVRLMCEAVGHPVKNLKRTRIAFLKLVKLQAGQMRLLSQVETKSLRNLVDLDF